MDVISQKHQEYIYKGTVLREHILNIKGRLQTSKRTRKNPSEADSMKEGWGGKGKEQLKKKKGISNTSGKLKVRRDHCTQKSHLIVRK